MQTPSVGKIVHYVSPDDSLHLAAIITGVADERLGRVVLITFTPYSNHPAAFSSLYDARISPGTWHYPEHVGTVQWHESENEAVMREGPISNSPEIDSARDYPDPEKNDGD